MTRKEPKPSKDKLKEAIDRTELFHDFIVNYINWIKNIQSILILHQKVQKKGKRLLVKK